MNTAQVSFLNRVADIIPRLFAVIKEGNQRTEYILGDRIINNQQVRLVLVAEVVDPGANPLATHSAGNQADQIATSGKINVQPLD